MAKEITMPKLSDTMTEGKLVSWKKSVGESVERGDIIAEVETDKATMELEAFASGVLLETRAEPGDTIAVGKVIGIIGSAGGKPEKKAGEKPEEKAEKKPVEKVEEKPKEKTEEEPEEKIEEKPGKEPEKIPEEKVEEKPRPVSPPPAGVEEKASPLVRRMAREHDIDLATVEGSGPDGRILKEDLEAAIARETGDVSRETGKAAPEISAGVHPLSRMRAAIAKTVSHAWQTIPHFSVTVSIEMGEAERVRQELKDAGTPVSLNDLVVKASALALRKFPRLNASFAPEGITVHGDVNIGIAVALEDGLLIPVIKGCQKLSLAEIAVKSRELADLARSGKITEQEISGGTFSVSNLGMYGVDQFVAVIYPPQGAILAVGAVADTPLVKGEHLVVARVMKATLSADHRLIDGAEGARFLAELKRILENPVTMLV
ncbi:MAG: 2-oxo acid dehydrogenase subunit E2 [Geobacter sp.]|nr:2-oxo acid dehydrogenase subunit E2 [Geobacter sp.]